MILYDIARYGKIGDQGDLIDWLLNDSSSAEFIQSQYGDSKASPGGIVCRILDEANKELRKPLVLSDFVRPEEPNIDNPRYNHIQRNTVFGPASDLIYNSDLQDWKNWTPLFPGWDHREYEVWSTLKKDGYTLDYFNDDRKFMMAGVLGEELSTRGRFIQLCKDRNIDLSKDENTSKNTTEDGENQEE